LEEYKRKIFEELGREYDRIRSDNKQKREQVINNIYTHIPRIKTIDEQINGIGLSVSASVLDGLVSPEVAIANMRERMDALINERNALLESFGFPKDATKEIFNCKKCKDKSYIDNERCSCYYDKLRKFMQKMSNVCGGASNTFERYDLSLYSKEIDSRYGISPYDNMKSVYDLALLFANEGKNAPKNLLFYGATGLGKTFTSDCIAKKYIDNGKTVFYMSAPKLFSTFEDYKFGRDTSPRVRSIIDAVNDAELLIIDDLGTEFRSTYVDSILFDIINSRLNEGRSMIVSTNLNPEQIAASYSDRISSRILGGFEKVLLFGEDIRLKRSR